MITNYAISLIITNGEMVIWKWNFQAIRNAKAQNEHLVLREINLEMLDEFGPEMYLQRNKQMEQTLIEAEKELRRAKEQVEGQ